MTKKEKSYSLDWKTNKKSEKMFLPSPLPHVGMLRDFSWRWQVTIYFFCLISKRHSGQTDFFISSGWGRPGFKQLPLANVKLASPCLAAMMLWWNPKINVSSSCIYLKLVLIWMLIQFSEAVLRVSKLISCFFLKLFLMIWFGSLLI